ncbi:MULTISPECIES: succinate dehydrogenase, cytochrome b556 subunit [Pseudomonadota]|jgi:succinate dehydrogenase / fumarate reductase cytochrome b subunit|uniref:Succinate dehydrogenase cytochrome b556 subunit n=1 Tax=Alicycliphilus denitrificans TaxID=179636 RepID=A0A3R7IIU4_9BURK|nr:MULTISPECIES: succinate dehydrogenase, cytochrome b556 subunit [Pseudomonadota]OJW93031.1 MAG: succinate dehydrogenase, cytochrome b556 subunit [Alicycliphilus sp. 69-12]HRO54616.1 succinate dehydrogenase, cytochrome b556 subunit [Alicycliphilus sp.]MBN9574374.1 succinate dehydrogenase, cytochrome b556 subunit [Alicycliphilus denitrificans]RKJ99466.1 succinate dehydrogenase, cytochrome b556 subunit [Alicycliphilus denitrificans]BCN38668.1 succinate dehydrogenase cytochrome b-556 subunit [Al
MTQLAKKRPEFRNIHAFKDLPSYRWPLAALVSGMHRISGLILFLLLPFIIWLFDKSVSSEISFGSFTAAFATGIGFVPAWFVKLVVLALIWSYLHHLAAGVRHLVLDVTHKTTKDFGRHSAAATLVFSIVLTLILGAKLFGLY